MYDIYNSIKGNWICAIITLIAFVFFLGGVCLVFCLFGKDKKKSFYKTLYFFVNETNFKKPIVITVSFLSAFVLFFSDNLPLWLISGKEDLRLAPDGTYCYYVVAGREESSSQYTLPAKIKKSEGRYFVENVYFSNGGYLYFDSYEYYDFDEVLKQTDQDLERWEISLTNNKAQHPKVNEQYKIEFWRLIFSIVPSAFIIIYGTLLLVTKNPKYSKRNIELQNKYYELLSEKAKAKTTLNETLNNYELTKQQEQEFINLYNSCIETIDNKINDIKKDLIE